MAGNLPNLAADYMQRFYTVYSTFTSVDLTRSIKGSV
jgi:hypothetical protein